SLESLVSWNALAGSSFLVNPAPLQLDDTPTPTPTFTPSPTPTPIPGLIFADDFESGDFSAWDDEDTDGGDLFVSTAAAAVGTYGMEALVDDDADLEISVENPSNLKHYSARFYLNPNSIDMPYSESMYLFVGDDDIEGWIACLGMERMGERYYTLSLCGTDDGDDWIEGIENYI